LSIAGAGSVTAGSPVRAGMFQNAPIVTSASSAIQTPRVERRASRSNRAVKGIVGSC